MQSRKHSALESLTNVVIGGALGWAANIYVGLTPKVSFWLTVTLTAVSFGRSFLVRRLFNWMGR